MGVTISTEVELTTINCGVCGGTYAINERYRRQKQEQSGTWHCPYCEVSWGYVEGENAKLKNRLAREQHLREQAEAEARDQRRRKEREQRRASAFKGQVTKVKNRVGRGVCPCCNRTFQNLQRHMAGQHPDWAPDTEPETSGAE